MIRRLLMALAVLGLAVPAAQAQTAKARTDIPVFVGYPLDATSLTYCAIGGPQTGSGRVKTSGSNTTVTAVSGLPDPFTNLVEGDKLMFGTPTGIVTRIIVTASSATSVVVDAAVNLGSTGVAFSYQTYGATCGTAATSGWFSVLPGDYTLCVRIAQMNVTGTIDFAVDTRNQDAYGSGPISLLTGSFASATYPDNGDCFNIGEKTSSFRVGLKINGTDDGGDTGANEERVFVYLSREN